MSTATTLTLSPVSSVENLQKTQFYQSNNNNTNFYQNITPYGTAKEHAMLLTNETHYTNIDMGAAGDSRDNEDTLLLEKIAQASQTATARIPYLLPKSNSYHGHSTKPKSTILKQDSLNGRIATSLTDSDSGDYAVSSTHTPKAPLGSSTLSEAGDGNEEYDSFLVNAVPNNSNSGRRGTSRTHGKSRNSFCYRAHAFISRNWYLSYLVPLSILLALMFVAYLTRDYAKRLLYWIETQNPWLIFALFMLLFILVSFPVVVGYFVLLITSGYLFGCFKGFLTVILGANIGIAIAHITIRSLRHRIPMHKLIKNETGRAILRVISGPRAFKVVLFTRLTPIPFGIQNAIFGVSSINPRIYHSATFLGLLPAQTINVYLGSTLRSMHEVLNNHGTAVTGYISFGVEVVCGVALMFWVVQKARKELSSTLLSDISTDGKVIDIQV